MRQGYTPQQVAWLRDFSQGKRPDIIAAAFNVEFGQSRTASAIKSTLKRERISTGALRGNPKGTLRLFTPEQAEFIRSAYREHPIPALTEAVNQRFGTDFTVQQIRSVTHNQGMKSGRTGRFYAGQTKVPGSGAKMANSGSFKKGSMSGAAQRNYVPIGSTRISKDGYLERKVTDDHPVPARRWVGEHRLVWEAANGPIPEGHVVVFLDGDKENVALKNLRCVPRGTLGILNKFRLNESSGEMRKAGVLTAELMLKAGQRAKA